MQENLNFTYDNLFLFHIIHDPVHDGVCDERNKSGKIFFLSSIIFLGLMNYFDG